MKKYALFIFLLVIQAILLVIKPDLGWQALQITGTNVLEMLSVIPPIFLLLGLLDVWVNRETMIALMGEKSGFKGMLIAFLLGSAAAGPLYAAFPIAGVLLKKGSKLSNVLIFIGAWSTTKIPLLLFETSSMGLKFTVTRLILDLFGIIAIAYISESMLKPQDKTEIYAKAAQAS
jgi:uncharacterized membrane protein YraQ (UPF0718 family)